MILIIMKPDDIESIPIIVYERDTVFSKRNITVIVLSLLTIVLFASFNAIKSIFGDIGVVALTFVSVMFGSGILSEVLPSLFFFYAIPFQRFILIAYLLVRLGRFQ